MSSYDKVKAWRAKRPNIREIRAAEARKWRAAHPEVAKAVKDRYREKHRDRLLPIDAERARRRREKDPEGQRRRNRAYVDRLNAEKERIAGRPRATKCELCGDIGKTVFDHCHTSGEFRGWICDRCNKVLGLVYDNKRLLDKMIQYLDKNWRLPYGEIESRDEKRPAIQ